MLSAGILISPTRAKCANRREKLAVPGWINERLLMGNCLLAALFIHFIFTETFSKYCLDIKLIANAAEKRSSSNSRQALLLCNG